MKYADGTVTQFRCSPLIFFVRMNDTDVNENWKTFSSNIKQSTDFTMLMSTYLQIRIIIKYFIPTEIEFRNCDHFTGCFNCYRMIFFIFFVIVYDGLRWKRKSASMRITTYPFANVQYTGPDGSWRGKIRK